MQNIQAKKNLGQHFLKDPVIAKSIVDSLCLPGDCKQILEVGPGMGILTGFLFDKKDVQTKIIDIDKESINFLLEKFPLNKKQIIEGDFLRVDLKKIFTGQYAVIGNFPYNISSQILFKVLDNKDEIPEVTGMFQKEVGGRIAGGPGSREYGILSVLMQTWYDIEVILELNENDFSPPPKVKSVVLHFLRKPMHELGCDASLFKTVIKTGFNQRRKTLRNALSSLVTKELSGELPFSSLRAEALGWKQFVELTNAVSKMMKEK